MPKPCVVRSPRRRGWEGKEGGACSFSAVNQSDSNQSQGRQSCFKKIQLAGFTCLRGKSKLKILNTRFMINKIFFFITDFIIS